jgi:hypothetical protein
MARTKKAEEKSKEGVTISIDVDSFVRTRDSVRFFNYFIPVMARELRAITSS